MELKEEVNEHPSEDITRFMLLLTVSTKHWSDIVQPELISPRSLHSVSCDALINDVAIDADLLLVSMQVVQYVCLPSFKSLLQNRLYCDG